MQSDAIHLPSMNLPPSPQELLPVELSLQEATSSLLGVGHFSPCCCVCLFTRNPSVRRFSAVDQLRSSLTEQNRLERIRDFHSGFVMLLTCADGKRQRLAACSGQNQLVTSSFHAAQASKHASSCNQLR